MPKPKQVHVHNAEFDLTGYVTESSVPAWERNGWTVVDDESNEQEPTADLAQAPLQPVPAAKQQPVVAKPEQTKE